MTAELRELTAGEALRRIQAGELSPDEYFDAYAQAAAADELNAYLWRGEPGDGAEGAGPLGGLPIAIKDIFATEGVPTTAGSRILEGYRPPFTATAVRRLSDAGARLLGKTNMDEFAMGSSNENSAYGPVLNPWDRNRVPGGSSGGSAAAVAGRLAPWAIGTDTGGSIRQPAALCGVVGLKPTYGAVSRYGMIAFASSLDQCGPLTRDVADAALLMGVLQGRDPCDSTSVGLDAGSAPAREDLRGLRFGVPRELSAEAEGIEPGVTEVFERTLALIAELGGEVDECELPHSSHGISAYYVLAPAEASANLARYDGVRFGLRAPDGDDLIRDVRAHARRSDSGTRSSGGSCSGRTRSRPATTTPTTGERSGCGRRSRRTSRRRSTALTSSSRRPRPTVAFELGARTADPLAMYMSDYCTVPMPLAGIPAISIPAGLTPPPAGGPELPVGFQIAGPAFSEWGMLDAAHALEQAIGFDARPPAGGS